MSAAPRGTLASFDHLDSAVGAIRALRRAGFRGVMAYMPYPEHEIEAALGYGPSIVRVFTLVGGMTGAATGFAFPSFTSADWPLVTGGKPILSIPAYVIIAFELAILFGALSTVIGLFIATRLPKLKSVAIHDPEFSAGRFGVLVPEAAGRPAEAREILERHHPAELQDVEEGELAGPAEVGAGRDGGTRG